ncbi:unnamed protein product [Paramecium primaurelia]|uniref:Uncharacterized protein n=1 Tax=Paramecium primaurelia TaxID=5886 RepID=A0A8S1MPG4_PARPR|nr:unnamed protein product [Paramecium primaurelia]CAD8081461.1 unnamed protein product [Paramecium primaurelia]
MSQKYKKNLNSDVGPCLIGINFGRNFGSSFVNKRAKMMIVRINKKLKGLFESFKKLKQKLKWIVIDNDFKHFKFEYENCIIVGIWVKMKIDQYKIREGLKRQKRLIW